MGHAEPTPAGTSPGAHAQNMCRGVEASKAQEPPRPSPCPRSWPERATTRLLVSKYKEKEIHVHRYACVYPVRKCDVLWVKSELDH